MDENTQPAADSGEEEAPVITFDEILADPLYKAEFDKRVSEILNKNSHPGVKGGQNTMDGNDQTKTQQGEEKKPDAAVLPTDASGAADTPTAETTTAEQGKAEQDSGREMTAEQFELYNDTLRRVSKTAKASLPDRYNAFEDAEVKAAVKHAVLAGEKPDVKQLAAAAVSRITAKNTEAQQPEETPKPTKQTADDITAIKVENALLKAGVRLDRVDAAVKLFMAEGAPLDKVSEFVAKYPEWQAQGGRVEISKAPPVDKKTAPSSDSQPALNDFERKVAAARKKAGLDK